MSAASLDRRSVKVCLASVKDLSDDVLDAGTLSRPLATSVRFFQVMALLDQYASKSLASSFQMNVADFP